MPWDTLIQNGQVVTRDGMRALDVAIEDGAIVALAPSLSGAAKETIDAAGLHVFPGVIDAHVHFNEPGRTDWEGWATGSAALAAGGGTCCFEMPLNAHPPTLDGPSFDLKRAAAEASSRVDFALWGGLTPANLDTLDELADRGVVGLKAFMSNSGIDDFGHVDDDTLYRGMAFAAGRELPVAVHAENDAICGARARAALAAGRTTMVDYLESRPVMAEVEAIQRAVFFARQTGCAVHIVHVSSIEGVRAAQDGRRLERADGKGKVQITIETCPHYLLLTAGHAVEIGARAKCAPPLRDKSNRDALRKQLRLGGIDVVGSDHSPSPENMKTSENLFEAWGGIAGVQSTLPGLLTIPHRPNLDVLGRVTATNVAERFGIARKGEVKVGHDADLAIVDVGATYTLTRDMLLDRHKLSPYVGRQFTGLVRRTIARGHTIFLDGREVGTSRGRLVTPERGTR